MYGQVPERHSFDEGVQGIAEAGGEAAQERVLQEILHGTVTWAQGLHDLAQLVGRVVAQLVAVHDLFQA